MKSSRGIGRIGWLSWLLVCLSALSFALFLRVTLYGRVEAMAVGPKGLLLPPGVLPLFVLWFLVARRSIGRYPGGSSGLTSAVLATTFAPMLALLPVTLQVLASESFAREYWIDRSLKVELLLGLPAVVLLLQASVGLWIRSRLTWRRGGPVLAVLVIALALRWAGMGWGLPFAFQPEETSIYFRWAMELALGGQWNPHYFQNPSLLIYLLGLEFMAVFAVGRALLFGQTPSELYMMFRGEQELFYGLGRLNSVVLGTAAVLLVYLIGRRLWNERAGLIAAALLAVNFLHVRNSQYAVNDVPSAFFLVASFYFAVRLAEEGRPRDYLLAGLMAGLAASTKYNAGMVVVAIVVAHWVHTRGIGRALYEGSGKLAASGLAAIGGFLLGTPFALLDFPGFRRGFMEQLQMGQVSWSGQSSNPTAVQFLGGVVQGAGIVAAVLALGGIVLLLARDRRKSLLLLSFPISYFVFMSAMDLFFVRWVVPVLPFIALSGAYLLDRSTAWASRRGMRYLGVALVALALLQPFAYSLRLDWLAHQTDTRHEANAWAERNIPVGSKVAVEAFSLLDQESLSFRPTLQRRDIELLWRATMYGLDYYRDNGFDYLAVSSFMYDRAFENPESYRDRVEFYQQLEREHPLLASFSPRADGQPTPFALDDLDTPFWHLFSYERPGPTIKVYDLRP